MMRGAALCALIGAMLCGCPSPSTPTVDEPITTTTTVEGPVTSVATSTKPTPTPLPDGQKVLWVKEDLVDCEGERPMKCMQIRESESEEWTWFYDQIEGFEHEPGHRYQLRVAVEEVADPPADASSRRYKLIQVVTKEPVP